MEIDAIKFIFKYIILNAKSLNHISKELIYKIYDYVFDNFIIIYKELIDKLKEEEKYKFYKLSEISRINENAIKGILENREFDQMKKGLIETKELINSPIIVSLSKMISSLIIEQFMNLIQGNFMQFFKEIKA